ncbi:hypothetical protein G9A89_002919 [Geosiphon pyriformis]|nr:hypothetical protein G9A89_002919 [Geosiphon pyriformis]
MVKKTKSSEKWEQLLVSAIVTLNLFVVPNEILDEIFIASSGTSSKIGQDQPLAILPNMVSFSRSLPVLEAKQSPPVGLLVLENWTDQIETESSPSLVSGATSGGAWKTITSHQKFAGWVAFTLVPDTTFKIKLAHVKTVFQSVHGFLSANSVHLATLKIAKSLVVSESGPLSAAVVLYNISLGVFAADIKTALSVFGVVTCVVLKPASIWQYVVVYFENLAAVISVLNHWSVLVDKNSVRILFLTSKVFNPHVVSNVFYAKISAPLNVSGFPSLVVLDLLAPSLATSFAALIADSAVELRLNSMKKQILDLTVLVKSVIEPIGSLVTLVTTLLNDNAVKTLKIKKNFLTMCNAFKGFANLLVGMSKDFASLKAKVECDNLDVDDIDAAKTSLLSEDTINHVVALWQMCDPEVKDCSKKTRLFFSEFIFNSRNLNGIIERLW